MRKRTGWAIIAIAAAAAAGGTIAGDNDDDQPRRNLTPTEAACKMLREGDSATEAYDILIGLDVPELAASRAVNRAIANGC